MSSKISNIIFDLGGVILDIDYQLTEEAFKSLGFEDFDKIYSQFRQSDLFDEFETGMINEQEFVRRIIEAVDADVSDQDVVEAWNAMLLQIPRKNLEVLERLKNYHRLFLLSNTNALHYKAFFDYVQREYGKKRFSSLFEKEYFSHLIGKRKPHGDIFNFVMKENGMDPRETLFIDDTIHHIDGARETGLHVYHKTPGTSWDDVIREYDLLPG